MRTHTLRSHSIIILRYSRLKGMIEVVVISVLKGKKLTIVNCGKNIHNIDCKNSYQL